MPARAVVFDLFHTLVDTEHVRPEGFVATDEVARVVGADAAVFGRFWAETYEERETSSIDLVDLVARFCSHHDLPLDAAQRGQVDAVFGVCKDDALRLPRPEVVEVLAAVSARHTIGVLSNCHRREVREWTSSPLAGYVSVFGCSWEIGWMKPHPRSYRWVLDRLGVAAGAAIYVGNGSSDELLGAREAGFGSVVHCNVFDAVNGLVPIDEQRRRAGHAEVSVTTLEELDAVLRAW